MSWVDLTLSFELSQNFDVKLSIFLKLTLLFSDSKPLAKFSQNHKDMRTSKFSKQQKLEILPKLDGGTALNELSREYQLSVATLHKWKKSRRRKRTAHSVNCRNFGGTTPV
jgi:Transposase